MKISVYVIARNEATNISDCLAPLVDLFDDIVVIDDASTDGTAEIVAQQFGITPVRADSSRYACQAMLRHLAVSHTRHPWVLKLDADERMSRVHLQHLRDFPESPYDAGLPIAGYFCAWRTYVGDAVIEDYKLPLARRDCVETGLAHENLQQDMRRRGLHAQWLPDVQLLHYPDPARAHLKTAERRARGLRALALEPHWYRHHWFQGYMEFMAGDLDAARQYFSVVCAARPRDFPVECLNSYMALADIAAREGNAGIALETLKAAQHFYAQVKDDFEVRVNFRIAGWLTQALRNAGIGNLEAVRTYLFAK